jgi:DNA polymerase-1
MGFPGGQVNPETGKLSLDDEALQEINTPYAKLFQRTQKLAKLKGTYLMPFKRELYKDRVHAFFNLHTVTTYRSSSDSPNLQNIPIRDPDIGKVIRGIIKPSDPNNVIVEIDYSTLEVVIGACLHRDPTMMEYLTKGLDFHRDTAQDCFFLGEDVPKPLRQMAKVTNFSLIYGDFYVAIAKKLWRSAESATYNGIPVHEYLKTKNIRSLGAEQNMSPDTFTHHMKGVCDRFWSERFPVFAKWRTDTWDSYRRNGCLYTRTGFRIHGVYKRNEILNVETQGCAFHCLLKSVIEITKEILKRRMGARLICQIHDSILAEVPRQEVDDYIEMATSIMTYKLAAQWPWIVLPLGTETEVGESWADKKPYHKS